jgi:tRNA/tmRNA/rRNA uracil-C5-methylase (TrmA/RlmC/RlmD family)
VSRLKKFEEKKKQLSRFQALKSIFSSLLITVTAVVMIVVVTPKSPEADIQSLEAFNNAIIYTINVTDMDNAIIEDTLIVTLENQFEEYETRLEVGNNNGRFLDLEDDTEYKLKVLADKV